MNRSELDTLGKGETQNSPSGNGMAIGTPTLLPESESASDLTPAESVD